jgi:hypothetical protein
VGQPHPPTSTWHKVGVREGDRLVLLRAPDTWTTAGLGVTAIVAHRRSPREADVVVAFCRSVAQLRRDAAGLAASIRADGMVWIAWPRKAAGHVSDLSDAAVRTTLLAHGVVDVKVAQLDEDWSGLKFVVRRELREGRGG